MMMLMLAIEAARIQAIEQAPLLEGLICAMAKGDSLALSELYVHTKSAVYGFALSIVKRPQVAEDVMQDAYIRVFEAAATYRPQGKPMAWILRIARNLSLMKLREAGKDGVAFEEGHYMSDSPGTEESLDRLTLKAAMQLLSDEERQIIILHAVTGLKHRETAEILDIPISTVLSKYRRALLKLRKYLEQEDGP